MTDPSDTDKKDFRPFDDEQRRKLEAKVKAALRAKEEQAAQKADAATAATRTVVQTFEPDPQSESSAAAADAETEAGTSSEPEEGVDPALEAIQSRGSHRPIDEDERARIQKLVAAKVQSKSRHDILRKHLLSMAGKQARIDEGNPFNKLILDKGQTWNSFDVKLITGPEMTTLRSVARLWQSNQEFYKVAVGYALDAAGTWRSHAWLMVRGEVNEVAVKYAVYYGVPLVKAETERFLEWVRDSR